MGTPQRSKSSSARTAALRGCTILTFAGLATSCESVASDLAVDYFAGKDELCATTERTGLKAVPRRLILVVDFYGGLDKEIYCTLVLGGDGLPSGEARYSASKQHCLALLSLEGSPQLDIEVVQDHLCAFSADSSAQ